MSECLPVKVTECLLERKVPSKLHVWYTVGPGIPAHNGGMVSAAKPTTVLATQEKKNSQDE